MDINDKDCNVTEGVFHDYDSIEHIFWSAFDSLLPIYYSVIIGFHNSLVQYMMSLTDNDCDV